MLLPVQSDRFGISTTVFTRDAKHRAYIATAVSGRVGRWLAGWVARCPSHAGIVHTYIHAPLKLRPYGAIEIRFLLLLLLLHPRLIQTKVHR